MRARREVLAARLASTAVSQRPDDPLRIIAERTAPRRLRTTTGWRDVGREAAARANVLGVPIEERLHITIAPWTAAQGWPSVWTSMRTSRERLMETSTLQSPRDTWPPCRPRRSGSGAMAGQRAK